MSSRYTVTALDRAVDVLDRLVQHREGVRLATLVKETGIPKSTLFRILSTLQERQCVVRDEERKTYRLGLKLWELGNAFLDQSDLQDAAVNHMKRLAETCGESVFLGVLDQGEVVYVQRVESPKSAVVVRKLGQRAPVYCTATGMALLAFRPDEEVDRLLAEQELTAFSPNTTTSRAALRQKVEQIRQTHVAVVDGEYNPSLLCVSSPILDERGHPVAAFTAALLSAQVDDERVSLVKEQIKRAAHNLSRERGYLGKTPLENRPPSSP